MNKQHVFLCKHCQHELTPPRAGMRLQEVKSWFRYSRCPACKQELRVVERVPEPVVPADTQAATVDRGKHRPFDVGQEARRNKTEASSDAATRPGHATRRA